MDLTYDEIGATRPGTGALPDPAALPPGYGHTRRQIRIGQGQAAFTAATSALRSWRMQRAARLGIRTDAATVDVGTEFSTGLGIGPARIWAPARVVWVIDTATRYGYGMGTLPGHPESGEEGFVVCLDGDGGVTFGVTSFSRPVAWWARLAGPMTRLSQRLVVGRYLRAMRGLAGRHGR